MILNWNKERWRTRDRLLDYDFSIIPANPHTGGLPIIYPWEESTRTALAKQLYEIAKDYGFDGTMEDFFTSGNIVAKQLTDFPIRGRTTTLYLDIDTNIIYTFKELSQLITDEEATELGGLVTFRNVDENITYIYLPIRASLIEDTILSSGDATEYIG